MHFGPRAIEHELDHWHERRWQIGRLHRGLHCLAHFREHHMCCLLYDAIMRLLELHVGLVFVVLKLLVELHHCLFHLQHDAIHARIDAACEV